MDEWLLCVCVCIIFFVKTNEIKMYAIKIIYMNGKWWHNFYTFVRSNGILTRKNVCGNKKLTSCQEWKGVDIYVEHVIKICKCVGPTFVYKYEKNFMKYFYYKRWRYAIFSSCIFFLYIYENVLYKLRPLYTTFLFICVHDIYVNTFLYSTCMSNITVNWKSGRGLYNTKI